MREIHNGRIKVRVVAQREVGDGGGGGECWRRGGRDDDGEYLSC